MLKNVDWTSPLRELLLIPRFITRRWRAPLRKLVRNTAAETAVSWDPPQGLPAAHLKGSLPREHPEPSSPPS